MSNSARQNHSRRRRRSCLPLKPNQWGVKHLALLGARIDFPPDPLTALQPIPAPQSFLNLASSSNSRAGFPPSFDEYVASRVRSFCKALDDPQKATDNCALLFVQILLEELSPGYGQIEHLNLYLGKKVIECYPYGVVNDTVAFLGPADRPTSDYAEETAYCLMLAQEAVRRTGASAGVLSPVVIVVRDKTAVVVAVEVDIEYLWKLEKRVSAMLERGITILGKNRLDVKVLKWDLCSEGNRRQFLESLASILQMKMEERTNIEKDTRR